MILIQSFRPLLDRRCTIIIAIIVDLLHLIVL